jgi:restriction endonuclease S subunit
MLNETENLFYDNLRLKRIQINKFQVSYINIKNVFDSFQTRIDPPAFINEGIRVIQDLKLKGSSFQSLKQCGAKVTRPGLFKRVYVKSKGLPYIKGSELCLNNPFKNCVYLSKSRTPFLDDLKLRVNQILITCAGSVGDIRLITKEFEDLNAIGSQDIIRVDCKQDELLTSEYIFAYLRLPFAYEFIQSLKYGSVIERIEPFHVDQIPVIMPSKELSKLVTERITRYKENIYSAFCQENQAIQLIEKELNQWQN